MIRTQLVRCELNKETADSLNLASGRIYSGIVSRHWRLLRQTGLWLSEKSMRRLSDLRVMQRNYPMHAHSIDFYSPANARTRWAIGEFITLLLIGTLLLWRRPIWLRRTSTAAAQWLPSMGRGLLTLFAAIILIPVALALIILLAIGGSWLTFGQLTAPLLGVGLAALVLAIALLLFAAGLLSKIIVAYLGGRLLLRWSLTTALSGLDFAALALGLVIYMVLRALPFGIGWVIGLLVTLLGLGASWVMWRRRPRPRTVTVVTTRERSREVPA